MDILKRIPWWGFWALLVYMPFHIFLSQSLSLVTGGLEEWKIAKDVVLFGLVLFTICLVWKQKVAGRAFNFFVLLAVLYGLLHILLWALHPDLFDKSAVIGIIYNTRLVAFLLLGYGAYLLQPTKFALRSVFKIVLIMSTVVAALGVLQFFLPKDMLTHVGYSIERGARPAFFIDDNASLPRVMSTLREPNALGAYLLVPIALLVGLLIKASKKRRPLFVGLLLLHGVALFLTFSRSAWLAVIVELLLVLWWQYREWFTHFVKKWWTLVIAAVLVLSVGLYAGRNNDIVQHYVTHQTKEKIVDLDSDDYHKLLLRQGIEGVANKPLGHGPGTAGLASIQNPKGGQLTENYYVQIAYEVGVIGLALFITLNVIVYRRLARRPKTVYTVALLASFWGYVLTNMLLHTWSNEAVAAQWWLAVGVIIAANKLDGPTE